MPDIGKAYVQIIPSADGMQGNLEKLMMGPAATAGQSAGGAFMGSFGKAALAAGGVAAAKIGVDFLKDTMQTGMEFGSRMSQLAATMDMPVSKLGMLSDAAREAGKATRYSAAEAAEALNFMALAGYDAQTQTEMLPTVLNLAAAGNMDLALATDMITDSQSALNLSMDGTIRLVDQMAKASSKTNTSVAQLGEAILTVGGNANYMKGGTTELATVLGILADNGIKGSEGGTHLRNMLLSLADPTKDARTTLDRLNVSIFDAEGNMRSFANFFPELKAALGDLTSEDQLAALNTIFNTRDIAAVSALLDTLPERYAEVAGSLDNAAGSAQRMADIQTDNLQGDLRQLKNAVDDVKIAFFEGAEPAARSFVQGVSDMLSGLVDFAPRFREAAQVDMDSVAGPFYESKGVLGDAMREAMSGAVSAANDGSLFLNAGLTSSAAYGEGASQGLDQLGPVFQGFARKFGELLGFEMEAQRGPISAKAQAMADGAKGPVEGLQNSSGLWGNHYGANFASGIRAQVGPVAAAAAALAQAAAVPLKHSVPVSGPLADDDLWGKHLGENFIRGMQAVEDPLKAQSDRMAAIVRDGMQFDAQAIRTQPVRSESDVAVMINRIEAANDRLAGRLESAIRNMGVYIDRRQIGQIVDQDLGRVAQSKMRRAV